MAYTTPTLTTTTMEMTWNESGSSNATLTPSGDLASLPPRMAFLALFIVIALVANGFIVVVVLQSAARRASGLHVVLLNLAGVCLVDGLLNMPLVLGALAANTWPYGEALCRGNAFLMNLVLIETLLTQLFLAVERFVAVKAQADSDRTLSRVRVGLVLAYSWLHSLAFSLPLLAGAVPSTFNQEVHLCVISGWSSLAFVCLTSIFCFLVPIVATVVVHALTVRATYAQRSNVRTIIVQNHYSEKMASPPRIIQDSFMAKYAAFLFLIWLLLDLPYVLTACIKQYQHSSEFQANAALGGVEYPWVVDVTLTWTRFAFSAVFPVFTLCWSKEYWQAAKEAGLCRRSNSVVDIQASARPGKARNKRGLGGPEGRDRGTENQSLSFSVPVLFATANGIHIQTSDPYSDSQTALEEDADAQDFQAAVVPPLGRLRGRKCDVVGTPADYLAADTSDYDSSSEVEPYSSSQPISARDVARPDVQRSSSQPEVKREREDARPDSGRKRLLQQCGTDSGLDLSGATCTTLLSKNLGTLGSVRLVQETSAGHRKPLPGYEPDNSFKDSVRVDVVACGSLERDTSGPLCACDRDPDSADCGQCGPSTTKATRHCQGDAPGTHHSRERERRKPRSPHVQADRGTKAEISAVTELSAAQVLSTQRPPIRLQPLESPSRASTSGKRDKSPRKRTRASRPDDGGARTCSEAPSQRSGERASRKTSRRYSHRRQGTADSQRALMGSGSSSEFQDLKAQCCEAPSHPVPVPESIPPVPVPPSSTALDQPS